MSTAQSLELGFICHVHRGVGKRGPLLTLIFWLLKRDNLAEHTFILALQPKVWLENHSLYILEFLWCSSR